MTGCAHCPHCPHLLTAHVQPGSRCLLCPCAHGVAPSRPSASQRDGET